MQPNVYFEGQDPVTQSASVYSYGVGEKLNPATVTVGILAVGIVGVAGTATALYLEVGFVFWGVVVGWVDGWAGVWVCGCDRVARWFVCGIIVSH